MERAGIAGPLFISVGQPDQLRKFLDINPELEECPALIDTSADYAGYRAAGFTNLLGESVPETPPDFKPPKTMGGMKWLSCAAAIRRDSAQFFRNSLSARALPTLSGTCATWRRSRRRRPAASSSAARCPPA